MIAYIFSENELKFLCGKLGVHRLAKHQFKNNIIDESGCEQALCSLSDKGFASVQCSNVFLNSAIAMFINAFNKAERLLIGNGERKFTAYLTADITFLLINDENSENFLLYPYENEDALVKWLNENGIYEWIDIRLEEN